MPDSLLFIEEYDREKVGNRKIRFQVRLIRPNWEFIASDTL